MRKATAILLLVITAIFAIRPVIAMHFCDGELHSFNLYPHHEPTGSTCCQSDHTDSVPGAHHAYAAPWSDCCDNTLLELSTDDFQNKTGPSISRVVSSPLAEGTTLFTNLLKPLVPETDDPPSRQGFPPEGLFLRDIDILTYICIYRI